MPNVWISDSAHALVRLDIKEPLHIHPHRKICEPSTDTAVTVEQHVSPVCRVESFLAVPTDGPQHSQLA